MLARAHARVCVCVWVREIDQNCNEENLVISLRFNFRDSSRPIIVPIPRNIHELR